MKVLLINPAWKVKSNNLWKKVSSCYPSLGLAYIAAVLEKGNHEVFFLDMQAENYSLEDVVQLMDDKKYAGLDYLGITATTPLINCAYQLAKVFKEKFPKIKVVLGGTHPSVLSEEVLANEYVDIVVRGEGEITMQEIVNGVELPKILGISYKNNNLVVHNADRPYIESLDELPIPAYHLMPIKKYRPAVGSYRQLPAMSIFATRGCPGQCRFCNRMFKGKIRSKSAKKIVEEIKVLHDMYGIKEISFYDDNFTVLKENLKEFCRLLKEEDMGITWSCFTRANYVDKESFKMMKDSGCHLVMMGVESGSQRILDDMNKILTLDQIKGAVKICKDVGLEVRAAYMLGYLGETKETMEQTLKFAMELDTESVQFNILTAYPGTEVWDIAKKNGWLNVKDYDYTINDFTIELPTVSRKEILDMYRTVHRRYYLRPRIIRKRVLRLRSWTNFKQELLGALAVVMHAD
ncbi:MAG: radical SAM protein [archaeon]